MQHARQADTGPDSPVSWTLDNERNLIERFEPGDGSVTLRITLHKDSSRTREQVEAWYLTHVASFSGLNPNVAEGAALAAEVIHAAHQTT